MANFTDAFGLAVTVDVDGVTYTRSDGLIVVQPTQAQAASTFAGMAPSGWAFPASTSIAIGALLDRFTAAELTAVMVLLRTNSVASVWFHRYILCATGAQVSVTDPVIINGYNYLVAQSIVTSARATQILNLAVGSP